MGKQHEYLPLHETEIAVDLSCKKWMLLSADLSV
jgi:hypothetical protein